MPKMTRHLAAWVFIMLTVSAWGQDPAAQENVKWYELRTMLGRLEAEYDRLQVIYTEISRLNNACEDLRAVLVYPEKYSGLKDGKVRRDVKRLIR